MLFDIIYKMFFVCGNGTWYSSYTDKTSQELFMNLFIAFYVFEIKVVILIIIIVERKTKRLFKRRINYTKQSKAEFSQWASATETNLNVLVVVTNLNSFDLPLNSCAQQKHVLFGTFPLHGTARYGSLLGGFPLGTVPGTFFSTTSVEVPSEPYRYQNVTCKLCWSLLGRRKSSLPASLNLRHETQQTC